MKSRKPDFYPAFSMTAEQAIHVRKKILSNFLPTAGGCWELPFSRTQGYSNISIFGRCIRGHRASFCAFNRSIPEGNLVMHQCDNPACVNPDHLILGTQKQNVRDCLNKGRAHFQINPEVTSAMGRIAAFKRTYVRKPKPPRKPHYHKVSDEDVIKMRALRNSKNSPSFKDLGIMFNCSPANAHSICHNNSRTKPVSLL